MKIQSEGDCEDNRIATFEEHELMDHLNTYPTSSRFSALLEQPAPFPLFDNDLIEGSNDFDNTFTQDLITIPDFDYFEWLQAGLNEQDVEMSSSNPLSEFTPQAVQTSSSAPPSSSKGSLLSGSSLSGSDPVWR